MGCTCGVCVPLRLVICFVVCGVWWVAFILRWGLTTFMCFATHGGRGVGWGGSICVCVLLVLLFILCVRGLRSGTRTAWYFLLGASLLGGVVCISFCFLVFMCCLVAVLVVFGIGLLRLGLSVCLCCYLV